MGGMFFFLCCSMAIICHTITVIEFSYRISQIISDGISLTKSYKVDPFYFYLGVIGMKWFGKLCFQEYVQLMAL